MKYKGIIFDADGVIITPPKQFSEHYAETYGIPVSDMHPFFDGPFQDCIVGKRDVKETLLPFLPRWKWNRNVDDFLDEWFQFEHVLDERVISAIRVLKAENVPIYLATNQERYRGEYLRDIMGFGSLFDELFISGLLGVRKPDPDFFNAILAHTSVPPHELLFFDDTLSHVEAAQACGIDARHYTDFSVLEDVISQLKIL